MVEEIGWVIKKSWINDHGDKHGEWRHSANETYSNSCVHWLCLQNKLGKRLRNKTSACSKSSMCHRSLFQKAFKTIFLTYSGGAGPPCLSLSLHLNKTLPLSGCLWPSLYFTYVRGRCWKLQGKMYSHAIFFFFFVYFDLTGMIMWYSHLLSMLDPFGMNNGGKQYLH